MPLFLRPALLTLALASLGACVTETPVPVLPAPGAESCGAAGLQGLIGQPSTTLDTMRFAGAVRIIRPDTAVTTDYSPERLNITLDRSSRIVGVSCG